MKKEFVNQDFENLNKIMKINQTYFKPKSGYSPHKYLDIAKQFQNPVREKMKALKAELENMEYFNEHYDVKLCMQRKQSTKTVKGIVRSLQWIALVDKYALDRLRIIKQGYEFLPQLQVSIKRGKELLILVWLEFNTCEQKYRERLFEYLDRNSIPEKYEFFVAHKKNKIDEIVFKGKYSDLPQSKKIDYKKNKYYGVGLKINLAKNIALSSKSISFRKIIEELKQLNDEIFSKCFINSGTQSKTTAALSGRRRKMASGKFDIKDSLRKGTGNGKVRHVHKAIQNELEDYLKAKYRGKNSVIKLEEDFVDVVVQLPNENKIILYEIKTADSAIKCIKNGLGQLLFYNAWKQKEWGLVELVIVGLKPLKSEDKEFVKSIQSYLGDGFRYEMFNREQSKLISKAIG